jgi:GT2 family glycosyltransferase
MSSLVSVNLVVHNSAKYVRHCLRSIKNQTYQNIEINVWDNASTDKTVEIIELEIKNCFFHKSGKNLGLWPAQEKLLENSRGEYIIGISADVILDPDFVKEAVTVLERDKNIGAIQSKTLRYIFENNEPVLSKQIDTLGFQIFKSRRLINIAHGEEDRGQYQKETEIFGAEGAVPVFRRSALEDCRINGEIFDKEYFWYGDDFDIAWRLTLFGWKQVYVPTAIAYHERGTTHKLSGGWLDFIKTRRRLPIKKRRLDYRNTTLTIIKNDYLINFLKDLPHILWRQLKLWAYFLVFEPSMLGEIFHIAKRLPSMLKKRRVILDRAKISAAQIRSYFS